MMLPYGAGGVPGRGEIPITHLGDEIELNATTKTQDSASCVLVDQAIQIS